MSYAQRKEISGNRTLAIIFVVIIQFAIGYAIVTGLAYNVIKKTVQDLKTFDVEEQPPPPEKPPPPPKDMPKVPPPPMIPPSLVQLKAPEPPIQTVTSPVIPPVAPPVMAPPRPAPPPPPRQSQAPMRYWLPGTTYSYQVAAHDQDSNTVFYSLGDDSPLEMTIGPSGRVTGCSPSGSASSTLKSATCRLLTSRARFSPAQDANGNPTTSSYSQTIVWRIAE